LAAYLPRAKGKVVRQAWEEAEAEIRRSWDIKLIISRQSETKKIERRLPLTPQPKEILCTACPASLAQSWPGGVLISLCEPAASCGVGFQYSLAV
jgi:hypothetical protein